MVLNMNAVKSKHCQEKYVIKPLQLVPNIKLAAHSNFLILCNVLKLIREILKLHLMLQNESFT